MVEVAGDEVVGGAGRQHRQRPEGAVAVAQQEGGAAVVGGGNVVVAVAVEVAHRQRMRVCAGGKANRRGERAVAIAQQHRHTSADYVVGDDQIADAVAVHVRRGDVVRAGARGVIRRGLEGTVAVAQQHAHRAAADVRDGQVRVAVGIEVGDGGPVRPRAHRVAHRRHEAEERAVFQHVDAGYRRPTQNPAPPVRLHCRFSQI